ncbi:MAG TPA: hypothetical protein PKO06_17130 [Candidatus Ozemobacteraceae bacterium]|nr:hypothetical protein [Candidatus Ozemobacteraceae bacterium]
MRPLRSTWRWRLCRGLIPALSVLFLPALAPASDLPRTLRESEQWYHTGRLSEARSAALSHHEAFPKDLEALLILAKIDLEAENLIDAKKWLRLADAVDRHHPLVILYRRLLEDLEHRQGPITQMPEPLPTSEKNLTADWFKRNWFWNRPTHHFPKVPIPPRSVPDEFGIATGPTGVLESDSVARQAEDAFRQRQFLRAYLLFSDLVRDHPEDNMYQLGKARAAMALGLYDEARAILAGLQSRYRFTSENPLLSPKVIRFQRQP